MSAGWESPESAELIEDSFVSRFTGNRDDGAMQTSPRIPESRRRGPNGRFLPGSEEESPSHPQPEPEPATPTEHLMTDIADAAESTATDEVFEADSAPELPDDRFLNRELSWLDFNARVLALAEDANTPQLERAK